MYSSSLWVKVWFEIGLKEVLICHFVFENDVVTKHSQLFPLISFVPTGSADLKQGADRDETPPRTPTGNAPSSESDIEVSSPGNDLVSSSNDIVVSQEEDERLAKELSLKEAAAHDLSHRPKRRRFHESYNFNMKCPTPGCNSLGEGTKTAAFAIGSDELLQCTNPKLSVCTSSSFPICLPPPFSFSSTRSSNREAWETFLYIRMSSLSQPLSWWMQGTNTHIHSNIHQQGL